MRYLAVVGVFGVAMLHGGCSSGGAPSTTGTSNAGNGVDDVKAACEIRVQWHQATSDACTRCLDHVVLPPCPCNPELGACWHQSVTQATEGDCTVSMRECISACSATACDCIDACYASHAQCRVAASALDGCTTHECDSLCR